MCADDVVCTGAEPLFFLDYLAVGQGRARARRLARRRGRRGVPARRLRAARRRDRRAPGHDARRPVRPRGVLRGRGRRGRRCSGPDRVREGDVLIGLASSGLHANGYSLRAHGAARPATTSTRRRRSSARPLADELLEPCAIYAPDRARARARRARARRRAHHRRRLPRERPARAAAGPRRRDRAGSLARARRLRPGAGSRRARPTTTCSRPSTWASAWCSSSTPATPRR